MYRYVIFDFDGTLADSGDVAIRAINKMSENHGFESISEKDIPKLRKMSVRERCGHVGVNPLRLPLLANEYYGIFSEMMSEVDLYPGIEDLISRLHGEGAEIAVISSNSESNIRKFLKMKGIDIINEVICSNNLLKKHMIIRSLLKQKGLNPEDVIYVGDETRDIKASRKAGVKVIWVDWGLDLEEKAKSENPDYKVSDPAEIYKIVKEG
jgi:phosphoglycolate phosphatase